jgi:Isocitrate/isopropylmalate dehydrogenase
VSAAGRSRLTVVHKADELPATDGLLLRAAERLAPGVLLLRHLGEVERADRLEAATESTVAEGTTLTQDVAWGDARASTAEVADAIVAGVRGSVGRPSP